MDINKFMFELNNVLYENNFDNIEVHIIYSDINDIVVIRVIGDRYKRHYDYGYSVSRHLLDNLNLPFSSPFILLSLI